ncbi:MAG: hypothetical protein IK042_05880, partial [Bacteroidales bacterium]|nr:hypothetical protein [Bacteroidales bacterium]
MEITSGDGFTLDETEKKRVRLGERFKAPSINYDPLFNPFKEKKVETPAYKTVESSINDNLMEEQAPYRRYLQVGKDLVATQDGEGGVMLINIARARERIFYEKYLNSVMNKECAIQEELFPKSVTLDHATFKTLMDNKEKVAGLGFEIRQFGKDSIVVSGTPADFKGEKFSIEECIEEIAQYLESGDETEFFRKVALEVVRHTNFSYTETISEREAEAVMESLFKCKESATSPTGGYCVVRVGADEIKKRML